MEDTFDSAEFRSNAQTCRQNWTVQRLILGVMHSPEVCASLTAERHDPWDLSRAEPDDGHWVSLTHCTASDVSLSIGSSWFIYIQWSIAWTYPSEVDILDWDIALPVTAGDSELGQEGKRNVWAS